MVFATIRQSASLSKYIGSVSSKDGIVGAAGAAFPFPIVKPHMKNIYAGLLENELIFQKIFGIINYTGNKENLLPFL